MATRQFLPTESIDPVTDGVTLDPGSNLRSAATRQAFVSSKPSWESHLETCPLQRKWIRDPEDVYHVDIPDRLQSVPIEWAVKWKKAPVLRRSIRDSTRKDGTIHEKHYRNQIVDADIIPAFLETPLDEAIMKLMGHMSLTRDPNAPAEPTSAQRRQVQANVEVIAAKRQADISTKAIRKCYSSIAAAKRKAQEDPTVQVELDNNTNLRKAHDRLFKRKLTSLFEISREEYFSYLRAACLENQHTGQEEPAGPSRPAFLFSERKALAKLLFPPPTSKPRPHQEQIEDSCQIIRLYASLCGRREYPRTRRRAQRDGQDQSKESRAVSEIKPCFLDTEPDIYPMQCPGDPMSVLPRGCRFGRERQNAVARKPFHTHLTRA